MLARMTERRDVTFVMMVTPEERAMLQRIAEAQDRSASAVVRTWIHREHEKHFGDEPTTTKRTR
jgi:hypothetical protein